MNNTPDNLETDPLEAPDADYLDSASHDEDAPARVPQSFWKGVWWRMRHNRRGMVGFVFVVGMLLVSLLSPLIANNQPIVCNYQGKWYAPAIVEVFQMRGDGDHWIKKAAPFNKPQFDPKTELGDDDFAIWPLVPWHEYEQTLDYFDPPSADHWLGTDELGRDVLARLIHGASVAMKVGFISMAIATAIGVVLGSLAGYFGGWVDIAISRVIEVVICFPVFFLILSVMVMLEPSITNVMIVIGLTGWTSIARFTRGEFIRCKSLDYVLAAKALGLNHRRIMFRHILPNALTPVLVSVTFGIAGAIMTESGLSWLGFGVQAPAPSWGNMLRTAYDSLRVAPHLVYPPCVMIFLAVLSYNLVGDALRDAIDPQLKKAANV
ncbi:MAG: ABC transporter permease [Planctomycetota bacterium]|jgi:peptide/nickel transport system permease protein